MEVLIKIKDWMKAFYGKFDIIIVTLVKFAIAFAALKLISDRMCYVSLFENPFLLAIIALVCSLLPFGLMAAVLSLCVLANVYKASLEMAVILGLFLVIIALLYYSFHPGDPVVLILTPLLFALKVPFIIPLMVGLAGGIISIIPVSCGIVIYYLLVFVKGNPAVIALDDKIDILSMPGKFLSIIDTVVKNKEMWMIVAVFAAVVAVVYVIRRLPFKFSWFAAAGLGTLIMIFADITMKLDMSIILIIVSCFAACIYIIFTYDVDYKGTQRLQFSDDDYYYYVTAVPRLSAETFDGVKTERKPAKRTGRTSGKTEVKKRDIPIDF